MSKFGKICQIIFSLKVSKTYFSQFHGHNLGKNVINGVNLVEIGHFWLKCSKLVPFWGQNYPHMSKFGKSCQIIFSIKHSKNYFSQVYGHNFGQKRH